MRPCRQALGDDRHWGSKVLRNGTRLSAGGHVRWNSEAGYVQGTLVKVLLKDVDAKGNTRRCSPEDPQNEIKNEKTNHAAMHRASVLKRAWQCLTASDSPASRRACPRAGDARNRIDGRSRPCPAAGQPQRIHGGH